MSSTIDDSAETFHTRRLKWILAVSIFIMGFLSVFAPRKLTGKPELFSLGNMMASGVLLSAGLVHQLANSAAVLNVNVSNGDEEEPFPWAMFTAGLTFMFFLVLEESMHLLFGGYGGDGEMNPDSNSSHHDPSLGALDLHAMMHGNHLLSSSKEHTSNHRHAHTHAYEQDHSPSKRAMHSTTDSTGHGMTPQDSLALENNFPPEGVDADDGRDENSTLIKKQQVFMAAPNHIEASCSRIAVCCASAVVVSAATNDDELEPSQNNCCRLSAVPPIHGSLHSRGGQDAVPVVQQHRPSQVGSFLQSTKTHEEDPCMLTEHHHHEDHIDLHLHGSILASGILMLALSIHSIFAGVSIGIEQNPDSIAGTAIAILAHKSFEGFSLGSSLVNAQMDHSPFWVLSISFACATPLGIWIGAKILHYGSSGVSVDTTEHVTSSSTRIAIVQAIVAGTFLYISIVEIGAKELLVCRHELPKATGSNDPSSLKRRQQRTEVGKLLCFVVGYLAMSALALVV